MSVSKQESNKFQLFLGMIFLLVGIALSMLLSYSSIFLTVTASSISNQSSLQVNTTNLDNTNFTSNIKDIFKKVEGSVVQVTSKIPITNPNSPQQQGGENQSALGSGFVYDRQGHIVTNNHVVGNSKVVDVTSIDGNRYTANVTGRDPFSDLAVLKILNPNDNGTQKLSSTFLSKPIMLGNSSELEVGDQVIAIGNPYGLDNTMTTGIVSQIGRLFPDPSYGYSIPDIIQTDAAINPGNSGGPLLNMKGDVIGLNTGILSSSGGFSGIGFAISSNTIKKIVPVLIENGTYTHPYLGLTGASLTSDLTQRFKNLPSDLKGVVVDSIMKNGSADKSGIKGSTTDQYGQKHGGDIVTSVDGKNITRFDDLVSYLEQNKSPGNNITLTVYRDGKYVHMNIVLAGKPASFITSSVPYPPPNPSPIPPKPPNRAPPTP
jgi:S1-C subfamily serine protease